MGSVSRLFGRWFTPAEPEPSRTPPRPEPPSAAKPAAKEGRPGAVSGPPPAPAGPKAGAAAPQPPSTGKAPEPAKAVPPPEAPKPAAPVVKAASAPTEPPPPQSPAAEEDAPWSAGGTSSVDSFVDSFFDDLDTPVEPQDLEVESKAPESPAPEDEEPSLEMESPETREMFGGIAATYVRPVRQFMTRLQGGPVSAEWLEICLPALSMVGRSARAMGFSSLLPTLDHFESLLREAADGNEPVVEGPGREAVLAAFSELAAVLPEAFAFQEGEDQRDTVIVHSLLRQVPDVGKVTLDKVFSAGLTTVEMLERANANDLTQTTGVSPRLSERICEAVAAYCVEREARQGFDAPSMWLEILRPVFADLEEHHAAFQDCGGYGAEDAAGRRTHRRARETAALRLNVLLAEMGEVQLVDETQRLSFDHRIQRLREFVASLDGRGPAGTDLPGMNLS